MPNCTVICLPIFTKLSTQNSLQPIVFLRSNLAVDMRDLYTNFRPLEMRTYLLCYLFSISHNVLGLNTTVIRPSNKTIFWCRRRFGFYFFNILFFLYFFFFFFFRLSKWFFSHNSNTFLHRHNLSLFIQIHWTTKTPPESTTNFTFHFDFFASTTISMHNFSMLLCSSQTNSSPSNGIKWKFGRKKWFLFKFCCYCLLSIRSCDAVKRIHTTI